MSRQTELLIKPTIGEILRQAEAIGLPISQGYQFFNYYQSNGWKVGKNPMRCWKSALSGWKCRFEDRAKPREAPVPIGLQVRAIEKVLETHKGNPDRAWSGRATMQDVQEYRDLKRKLGDLYRRIAQIC